MNKQLKQLEEFQSKFDGDSGFNTSPTVSGTITTTLRYLLQQEELDEYREACNDENLVEILDALVDQAYVLLGTVVTHGLQGVFEKAFDEVHASNMSKLGEDGKPIINGINAFDDSKPRGKVLKGKNYFKPNLKQFL